MKELITKEQKERMEFTLIVVIYDPETPEEMNSDIILKLKAIFFHYTNSYGNGYHVVIKGKELPFGCNHYDLRYDKSFNRENKEDWLLKWAINYWSGENGSYKAKLVSVNYTAKF